MNGQQGSSESICSRSFRRRAYKRRNPNTAADGRAVLDIAGTLPSPRERYALLTSV